MPISIPANSINYVLIIRKIWTEVWSAPLVHSDCKFSPSWNKGLCYVPAVIVLLQLIHQSCHWHVLQGLGLTSCQTRRRAGGKGKNCWDLLVSVSLRWYILNVTTVIPGWPPGHRETAAACITSIIQGTEDKTMQPKLTRLSSSSKLLVRESFKWPDLEIINSNNYICVSETLNSLQLAVYYYQL